MLCTAHLVHPSGPRWNTEFQLNWLLKPSLCIVFTVMYSGFGSGVGNANECSFVMCSSQFLFSVRFWLLKKMVEV